MNFNLIPSDAKIPMFMAEVSGARALPFTSVGFGPSLVIGQGLGTAFTTGVPVRIRSQSQIDALVRPGSMLSRMVASHLRNDGLGEAWALPLADADAAVKATKTINFDGTATAAGVIPLRFGGVKVPVVVSVGTTAAQVATAYQAALGVDEAAATALGSTAPVTAAASTKALAVTARNGGTAGNGITIDLAYGAGESMPAGLTITELASVDYVNLASGATDPSLSTLAAMLGEKRWSFISHPWFDVTPATGMLALIKAEMADSSVGRWGPTRKYYGHAFGAKVDTDTNISALTLLNDPHMSMFGIEGSPSWSPEVAAAFAARCAGSARTLASRPVKTLELIGILPPRAKDVWDYTTRKTLLDLGWEVPMASEQEVRITRGITTYIKNAYGATDPAFLDCTTLFNLDYQLTGLEATLLNNYPRHILVNDGTPIGSGVPAVTPLAVRNLLISTYKAWERQGLVENAAEFAANLLVERDESDPNRINIYWPPDLANAANIWAVLAEFRLQYAEAA